MPEASRHRIFSTPFAKVYPLYVQKAERKNRTKKEVDQIICWLTGYTAAGLQKQIKLQADVKTFFDEAPAMNPKRSLIKGVVCGVRVEEVEDPLMKKIRYLDKLIDELAQGQGDGEDTGSLVERAACGDATAVQDVRVYLRGLYARVTHEFLHRANVNAGFDEMRGEAVAECVAGGGFIYSRFPHGVANLSLNGVLVDMMATPGVAARITRRAGRGKNILPTEFEMSSRILAL